MLDELRRSDFARLDRGGHVYLDYTGGGLYAESQLREHMRLLERGVFGNPHSINPTSAASTELVERARASVLEFFNASPEEYVAIFTPNATGALRLVGEAYPFHPGRPLPAHLRQPQLRQRDPRVRPRAGRRDHLRAERRARSARRRGRCSTRYLTDTAGDHHNLLAYPAQSNFSGVQHPLEWIEQAHSHGWDVLLDAAAYVPDQPARPERVASRLRRALLLQDVRLADRRRLPARPPRHARQARAAVVLRRNDRRGVRAARVLPIGPRRRALRGRHRQLPQPPRGRDRPALPRPHRHRDDPHARRRARRLAARTRSARCGTAMARPAAAIYGPRTWQRRGATIAFNFLHPDGSVVDERYVDRVAGEHNISLRTGCFCNPGAGEVAFTISRETLVGGEFGEGMTLDDYVDAIGLPSGGAIRASLGLASNFADLHRFQDFAAEFIDLRSVPDDLPPRNTC